MKLPGYTVPSAALSHIAALVDRPGSTELVERTGPAEYADDDDSQLFSELTRLAIVDSVLRVDTVFAIE